VVVSPNKGRVGTGGGGRSEGRKTQKLVEAKKNKPDCPWEENPLEKSGCCIVSGVLKKQQKKRRGTRRKEKYKEKTPPDDVEKFQIPITTGEGGNLGEEGELGGKSPHWGWVVGGWGAKSGRSTELNEQRGNHAVTEP